VAEGVGLSRQTLGECLIPGSGRSSTRLMVQTSKAMSRHSLMYCDNFCIARGVKQSRLTNYVIIVR
jgi:hypothetical protein